MDKMIRADLMSVIENSWIPWDVYNNSSVLITGATGLIGSLLIRVFQLRNELNHSNIKIFGFARSIEKCRMLFDDTDELVILIGDITEPLPQDVKVEYIVHTASVTTSRIMVEKPVETIDTAVLGTKNVLAYAKDIGAKGVVYLSSMEVYGSTNLEDNPIDEEKLGYVNLRKARSSYPESKRICELMCNCYHLEYGVPITTVRLAQTFGVGVPLNDNRAPIQFAKCAINDENIVLHTTGKSISNFCYSTDAIIAVLMLLASGDRGEAYNVCNSKETRSISEIAELVCSINGKIQIKYDIPDSNNFGYAPDALIRLSTEKIEAIGWHPTVDMAEAYIRTIDYLKAII